MKEIYLVAGERNMLTAVAQGGLWANVGETTVGVDDRLRGDDYRRKAAGGAWRVIRTWRVRPDASDRAVHRRLKAHPGALWVRSANTEEFFFPGDRGDGSLAASIVDDCMVGEVSDVQAELPDASKLVDMVVRVVVGCGLVALLVAVGVPALVLWAISVILR